MVVVSSALAYRRLAGARPRPGDHVLEIGCSTGLATEALAATGAHVLAVDISGEMVERTRARCASRPNVGVAQLNVADAAQLATLRPVPDVVFVDVGGNATLVNVAVVVQACLDACRPRLLVVRSRELAGLASRIVEVEDPEANPLLRRAPVDRIGRAVPELVELSRSADADDRAFAARRLLRIVDASARLRLGELVADPDRRVRRIARRDFGEAGGTPRSPAPE